MDSSSTVPMCMTELYDSSYTVHSICDQLLHTVTVCQCVALLQYVAIAGVASTESSGAAGALAP